MTQLNDTNLSAPIEQFARLIHSFSRQQKARLLQLVPELQTIHPDEASISAEQEALMAYFDRKLDALPARNPLQDDVLFVGGLTVAEFFALPEEKQARIWNQAHLDAEQELANDEQLA